MMLNTDIGMVFKQNDALAECITKANADNKDRRKQHKARQACAK